MRSTQTAALCLSFLISGGALGATRSLESDLMRLEVTSGTSYTYRVVDKSTGNDLVTRNLTQFTFGSTTRTVGGTSSVTTSQNSIRVDLNLVNSVQKATVLFTLTAPNVLQVDLSHDGGTAASIKEQFTDHPAMEGQPAERYYGLTEYPFAGALDNRGMNIDIIGIIPGMVGTGFCNARAPFYFTNRNYGIYTESAAFGHYTIGVNNNTSFWFSGPTLRYHILYGGPRQILQSYNNIAGGSYMPPDWAFGSIWWRDDHHQDIEHGLANAQALLLYDALQLQQLGIPAAGMWIDRPYTTDSTGTDWGWGGLDAAHDHIMFDSSFPDPAAMIAELNTRGMQLMTWISNRQHAEMWTECVNRGFLFPGSDMDEAADLSKPEAYAWYRDRLHSLYELGTRGYKIDRADEGEMPSWAQNSNTVLGAQAAAESVGNTPQGPNNAYIFARSIYDKGRRYSAVWNGDTEADWSGLQVSVKNVLRCANINFPMWGSDTGGYGQYPSKELFARWLGFSAYTPMMEILLGPGRTIWDDYTEDLTSIARSHCQTHHNLIPYVRSYLYHATLTGLGVARPLCVMFPDDPGVLDVWDEYMYGDALLVAPVTQPSLTSRTVYLPAAIGPDNRSWLDYTNKWTVYTAGQTVTLNAPLATVPVLLRSGGIVVQGNVLQANQRGSDWSGTAWFGPNLTVEAFVGPEDFDSSFDFYTGLVGGPVLKPVSLIKTSTRLDLAMDLPLLPQTPTTIRLFLDPTTSSAFASGTLHVYVNGVLSDRLLYFYPNARRLESIVVRSSADLDHDSDVDFNDLDLLESCLGASGADYPAGCQLLPAINGTVAADFDQDGDVDQSDFGVFQNCVTGQAIAVQNDCGS